MTLGCGAAAPSLLASNRDFYRRHYHIDRDPGRDAGNLQLPGGSRGEPDSLLMPLVRGGLPSVGAAGSDDFGGGGYRDLCDPSRTSDLTERGP